MRQDIVIKSIYDREQRQLGQKIAPYVREDRIPWYLIKAELREDEDIREAFRLYCMNCLVIYFTQDVPEVPTTLKEDARLEMRNGSLSFVRHLNLIFGLEWKYVAEVLIENKED